MSFSNESDDDVPQIEDLHSSMARFATITYLAIMALFGTVGNLLVILTVVKTTKLHRLTYILIANLSIVGLLVCLIIIPSHIVNIVNVGKVHSDAILCEIEGYLNFMLTLAMIANSNAIALNRYLVVNRQQVSNIQSERPRNIVIILILLWMVPIALAFSSLPFTGYHIYILDCFFLISDDAYWYVMIIISAPGIITTILISVCYSLILRKVRKSRLRVTATLMKRGKNTDEATSTCSDIPSDLEKEDMSFPQPSTSTGVCCATNDTLSDVRQSIADTMSINKKQYKLKGGKSKTQEQPPVNQVNVSVTNTSKSLGSNIEGQSQVSLSIASKSKRSRLATLKFQQEIRLTLQLFLVFALFCCLYMPMCVVHILNVAIPVSPDLWLTFFTLALSFSTTTWMLYGVLNRDFRKAYAKIIFCKK